MGRGEQRTRPPFTLIHAPVVRFTSRTRWSPRVDTKTPSAPHTAIPLQLPNAVALAATPLLAAAPADKHVPVPATAYVIPVAALIASTVHRSERVTARSPLGSMVACLLLPMLALVAATPRYAPVLLPVPA
jgi:hypothetical protein